MRPPYQHSSDVVGYQPVRMRLTFEDLLDYEPYFLCLEHGRQLIKNGGDAMTVIRAEVQPDDCCDLCHTRLAD